MKIRAIIVGCLGQDGYLINELLKKYNYEIFGISKKNFDISSNDKIKEVTHISLFIACLYSFKKVSA